MKHLNAGKWDRKTAAHLLVRSGFGATPEQIDAAAGKSLPEAVDDLFAVPETKKDTIDSHLAPAR